MEYFIEKDLFDEELNDEKFNVTQRQMNILDKVINKNYNYLKEDLKKRNFILKHPYLEYEKFIQKEKINNSQNVDNHLTISQKNEIMKNRLRPILDKQKSIINNIIYRKQNLNLDSNDRMNILYPKYNMENNSSSLISAKSLFNKKYNPIKKNVLNYRSYSLKDYRNKYTNEKMIDFGGLGANLGGEDWQKRQKLLERKKEYSNYVLFNEKQNIEERKYMQQKGKLIKKIKMNDNNNIFPLITNDKYSNDKKTVLYAEDFFPLKKFRNNKENNLNKKFKNYSDVNLLYHNNNIYNNTY